MKIPGVKAAVDKEWEKLENMPAWANDQSTEQKRGHQRGTTRAKNSPLLTR